AETASQQMLCRNLRTEICDFRLCEVPFAQCGDCFDRTRHAIFESLRDPRRLHQSPGIVDRLAGHIFPREPFTPADAPVTQFAADNERISVAPLVRSMPDRALERDADMEGGESHSGETANPRGCYFTSGGPFAAFSKITTCCRGSLSTVSFHFRTNSGWEASFF